MDKCFKIFLDKEIDSRDVFCFLEVLDKAGNFLKE